MKLPRRRFLHLAAAAAALPAVSRFAWAQAYPTRPVKIVVPAGPSGSYDIVGRALADQLAKRLDQTVVVENRAGAGTVVGTQAVIQSLADGYTLLVGGLSNVVFNVGLYNKPPYDPLNDLVPVALVFNVSYTLIGSKASPYASPKEIVGAAKKNPGKLTFADYRRWQRAAHCRRRLHEDHGNAAAGRSVPWPGLGLSRRSVGTSRSLLRFHALGAELHQIWPGQGHRNPYRETKPAGARCADHDGVRRPRSGDRFLDRAIRSGRYATGRDHSSPTGDHAVHARPQAAFRGCRRRADGRCAGSAQWNHQGRLRPLDRDHP